MGIDFSHGGAHWSYGGFHEFRRRLAGEIDLVLDEMKGFGGSRQWATVDDAIVPLLDHSDCDGELTPETCELMAPRLRELVKNWPEDDFHRSQALELADGMDLAAGLDEPLEFT